MRAETETANGNSKGREDKDGVLNFDAELEDMDDDGPVDIRGNLGGTTVRDSKNRQIV